MVLLDRVYNTGVTIDQVTLNNVGKYANLLVMISYSKRGPSSIQQMKDACYLDIGTEIGNGGYFKNSNTSSGHLIRVYKVPISGNSVTIPLHGTDHYQIYGLEADEDIILLEGFFNAGTAVTSVEVSGAPEVCFFAGTSEYNGKSYEAEKPYIYIDQSELTYSAYYKNSNSSSSVVLTSIEKGVSEFTGRWFGYVAIGVIEVPKAGDINAIRDWFKWSRYCKDDVDSFFINGVNEGLSAYQITFYGEPNKTVNIVGGSSGKTYEFTLNSKGKLTKLLFFELGETVTITYDETRTLTVTLYDRKTTIVLPYALIPAMTSNTQPSGECICSSKLNANFEAYYAFNQVNCDMRLLQGCWLAHNSDNTPYLIYEFETDVLVKSISLDVVNNGATVQRTLYIEGSIDGENYYNILSGGNSVVQTFTLGAHELSVHQLNWERCRYIRIRGVEPFYGGANQYACGFNAVQVTGMIPDVAL